ncbi:hypothetical protein O181_130323 [Austropuccinia psidii MF-1]|uniref:Uncharacterized protein n=1 Tax=Austropuccinia psidii MF-1 TaxID=1389203 RepID=A0A9Q3KYG2_9BASI|nr:hypothetical protein [Austropuccinia psidii MF-1]
MALVIYRSFTSGSHKNMTAIVKELFDGSQATRFRDSTQSVNGDNKLLGSKKDPEPHQRLKPSNSQREGVKDEFLVEKSNFPIRRPEMFVGSTKERDPCGRPPSLLKQ